MTNLSTDFNANTSDPTTPQIVLGLDFGIKKTGMALGNTLTQDARPFGLMAMDNGQPNWDNLLGIIELWQVTSIVVGLPLHMDDTESMISKRTRKFARRLAHQLKMRHLAAAVYLSDERLSSYESRQIAKEYAMSSTIPLDAVAACVILREFFAGQRVVLNNEY